MPKGWYDNKANKIKDDDDEEEKDRKRKYQKLCADKKPYFFIYNYDTEMKDYRAHKEKYEIEAIMYWGITIDELMALKNRTKEQSEFIKSYFRNAPVDMSSSTMNKICFRIEEYMDAFKAASRPEFDYSILKSGRQYDFRVKQKIEDLYQEYKNSMKLLVLDCNNEPPQEEAPEYLEYKDSIVDWFGDQCHAICPDDVMLCDILVDICYHGRNQKEIVWELCGDTIVENLLKHHNRELSFPQKIDSDGEFECMGCQFIMTTMKVGDDND